MLTKCTVEPPKRGEHRDKPFVLSREVVLFWRLLFLSLKMKHFSYLDTNTTNKRECNQLSHESVDVGSFCILCKDSLLLNTIYSIVLVDSAHTEKGLALMRRDCEGH